MSKRDQKEPEQPTPEPKSDKKEFKALPVTGAGAVGFLVAGPLGAALGAFVGDAFTGGEGTRRMVKETQELTKRVKRIFTSEEGERDKDGDKESEHQA